MYIVMVGDTSHKNLQMSLGIWPCSKIQVDAKNKTSPERSHNKRQDKNTDFF